MQSVNNQYTNNRLIEAQSNLAKAKTQNNWGIASRVTGASLVVLGIIGAAALVTVHFILPPVGISILTGAAVASALTALLGLVLCMKGHYSSLSARRNIRIAESDVSHYKAQIQRNRHSNASPVSRPVEHSRPQAPVQVRQEQPKRNEPVRQADVRPVSVPVVKPEPTIFQNVVNTISNIASPSESPEAKKNAEQHNTWIEGCGQSSLINHKKVIDFKKRKELCDKALSNARKENQSEQQQVEIFKSFMGVQNVSAADFRKYNDWISEDSPPEGLENDPVLECCVCPITMLYPVLAVAEPVAKGVIYDKTQALKHINSKHTSPSTNLPIKPSELIDLPDFPTLIECRLFDLAFPKK